MSLHFSLEALVVMALTFDLYVNVPGQSRCSPKSIQYIVRKLDMFLKKLSTNCQK